VSVPVDCIVSIVNEVDRSFDRTGHQQTATCRAENASGIHAGTVMKSARLPMSSQHCYSRQCPSRRRTDDLNIERRTRSLNILLTTAADRHQLPTSIDYRSSRCAAGSTSTARGTTGRRSRANSRSSAKHRDQMSTATTTTWRS